MAYDHGRKPVQATAASGAIASGSIADLAASLSGPRAVLCMVPADQPTEPLVNRLAEILAPEHIAIDGGNSNDRLTILWAAMLKQPAMHFVDVSTSWDMWVLTVGYSIMVGRDRL